MKRCRDCKWCRRNWFFAITSFGLDKAQWEFATCSNPKAWGVRRRGKPTFTRVERSDIGLTLCGPDATYWEPRKP